MVEQGSEEWKRMRLGKVTASRIADMIAETRSSTKDKRAWGASRATYRAQLVAERLTGEIAETYTNAAMQWGTEKEAEARLTYSVFESADVELVDFVMHPDIPMSGASPDGLIGSAGLLELKCPSTATHIETLLGREVPSKYRLQMLWQMECTGREWADFCSYDPRLPAEMRLFVKRLHRDEKQLVELRGEVRAFLAEVDATVEALTKLYGERAAA